MVAKLIPSNSKYLISQGLISIGSAVVMLYFSESVVRDAIANSLQTGQKAVEDAVAFGSALKYVGYASLALGAVFLGSGILKNK